MHAVSTLTKHEAHRRGGMASAELQIKRRAAAGKRQRVTRVPPFWAGDWVKIRPIPANQPGADLSGKVRQVKSLTGTVSSPDQPRVVWRVHFEDGRCLLASWIDRHATETEIRQAGRAREGRF